MLAARCGKKMRLAARGSTLGGKTHFFSWRQKLLDATSVGGECAAGFAQLFVLTSWFIDLWHSANAN
jgi:hypothetical protein